MLVYHACNCSCFRGWDGNMATVYQPRQKNWWVLITTNNWAQWHKPVISSYARCWDREDGCSKSSLPPPQKNCLPSQRKRAGYGDIHLSSGHGGKHKIGKSWSSCPRENLRPYFTNNQIKKGWKHSLSSRIPASQVWRPEFIPQYH